MADRSGNPERDLETDRIATVVEKYPIRCALLFGSRAHGAATASSDVDIAVAFECGLSSATRLERRIELTTALSNTAGYNFVEIFGTPGCRNSSGNYSRQYKALGIDDIDVTDLDRVRPEVGRSILETGVILVGDDRMLEEYREQFERDATDETHDDRMRRFDDVLERLEGQV